MKNIIEQSERHYYGCGDGRAINRHSARWFEAGGRLFCLDKNLSMSPPCYEFTENTPNATRNGWPNVIKSVSIPDGASWHKAKRIVIDYLSSL